MRDMGSTITLNNFLNILRTPDSVLCAFGRFGLDTGKRREVGRLQSRRTGWSSDAAPSAAWLQALRRYKTIRDPVRIGV